RKVSLIPGDGIGKEITRSVQAILAAAGAQVEWEVVNMGLETYELSGTLIPQEFVDSLNNSHVALKGPTTTPIGGGHRSINVTLRQMFNLYANVRPIKTFPGLQTKFDGIDMIIVRENTED